MTHSIYIDEDVHLRLKKLSSALNDTPNSIIRKLLNLEEGLRKIKDNFKEKTSHPTGKKLNILWDVFAKQAYFHKDGLWYMTLETFPGAYFDPNGYVLFASKKEYQRCPYLKIGPTTNLQIHLSEFPNYKKMK